MLIQGWYDRYSSVFDNSIVHENRVGHGVDVIPSVHFYKSINIDSLDRRSQFGTDIVKSDIFGLDIPAP